MRTTLLTGTLAVLSFACATPRAGTQAVASAEGASESHAEVLSFIQNDYPRALAEARARGVPVFVDAWVPW